MNGIDFPMEILFNSSKKEVAHFPLFVADSNQGNVAGVEKVLQWFIPLHKSAPHFPGCEHFLSEEGTGPPMFLTNRIRQALLGALSYCFFTLEVYEEWSCMSIEFWPSNWSEELFRQIV